MGGEPRTRPFTLFRRLSGTRPAVPTPSGLLLSPARTQHTLQPHMPITTSVLATMCLGPFRATALSCDHKKLRKVSCALASLGAVSP